jgi:transposase InsO family protein
VVGKLGSRAAAAVTVKPGSPGRLGALYCQNAAKLFLVDTGAVYSVLPYTSSQPASGPAITTASGAPIPCWGWQQSAVSFGGHVFKWHFLLAAVAFPLLGADFLTHFRLVVDLYQFKVYSAGGPKLQLVAPPAGSSFSLVGVRPALAVPAQQNQLSTNGSPPSALQQRLSSFGSPPSAHQHRLSGSTPSSPPAPPPSGDGHVGLAVAAISPFHQLLQEFPGVTSPSGDLPPAKHAVQHHIETEGRPVTAKYRRLDPVKLAAAKKEFAALERQGIVRRSNSNWSSPLHMVQKPDGTWRPCGDFRRLNLQTKPDQYTCPNIGDLTARLAGCKIFSKLDLKKGYHQVPVKEEDVCKTAIVTPFGTYEYLRMPFGLRNAGQTFQRLMDSVMDGLPYCFVYLDDVLVASETVEQHLEHLREVLGRLQHHGLVLNVEKCQFGLAELDYLGHHVSASGIRPMAAKVKAIETFPRPRTVQNLQTFLGMANFYRRFLPAAARTLRPLTDAVKGGQSTVLEWTEPMQEAFVAVKEGLCKAVELAHPAPAAEVFLAVDASGTHVGAALHQRVRGQTARPLAFFSAKLEPAQQKYSAFDRELLACYLAIRHFRWMLEGRKFYVLTDHKPLTFALHRVSDAWSARQQRQLSYIAEYTSDLRHVAGADNVVADALSRPAAAIAAPATSAVDLRVIARDQASCADTQQLVKDGSLKIESVQLDNVQLLCDVSTSAMRPLVPVQHRKAVFAAMHELAHPGARASRRIISARFVWRGCAADVTRWCRDCVGCAKGKVQAHCKTQVEPIHIPAARFRHVHVDLVGPLPVSSGGHSYVLTIIDRTSRWPEAVPLTSITAERCADAFVEGWVSRFGVPDTVTTDRGTQFSSATWACLARTLRFRHIMTSAYHPQANGMVERLHRQVKEALRARGCGAAWADHLPWVMLGIRAAPKEDSNVSPARMVYGTELLLPGQLPAEGDGGRPPPAADSGQPPPSIPLRQRSYAEAARGPLRQLAAAEWVYVRRGAVAGPMATPYVGPYRVLQHGEKTCRLQVGTREEVVSVDRLKPHVGAAPVAAADPPRRGRPPGTGGGVNSGEPSSGGG